MQTNDFGFSYIKYLHACLFVYKYFNQYQEIKKTAKKAKKRNKTVYIIQKILYGYT